MIIVKHLSLAEVDKFYPEAPGVWTTSVLEDENPDGFKDDHDVAEATMFFIGFHAYKFVLCNIEKGLITEDASKIPDDLLDQVSFFDADDCCWEPVE